MALSKQQRLGGRAVQTAFAHARVTVGPHLTLRVARGESNERRFAVLVPARIAPRATERNRIRRRIIEALQPLVSRVHPGVRITIVARTAQPERLKELRDDLLALMKKSGMVNT